MRFNKLHSDIQFSCLEYKMDENPNDFFARKLISSNITDSDFLSHWEKGKRPENYSQNQVCRYKGVSINKYYDESVLIDLYRKLFKKTKKLAPKKAKAKYFGVFKFKDGAGLIWPDGRRPIYHCCFFKCDSFNVKKIDLLQVKEF